MKKRGFTIYEGFLAASFLYMFAFQNRSPVLLLCGITMLVDTLIRVFVVKK